MKLISRRGLEIHDLLVLLRSRLASSGSIPHSEDGMLGYFYFAPNANDHFIFVGNPGAGKSTIMNGLMGKAG